MNNQTCKLISLNAKYHLHVQHPTNAHNKYASRNKILLGHKSESTWSNARQNNKYNATHKSLQVHENNPKSLQKQHGYKSDVVKKKHNIN